MTQQLSILNISQRFSQLVASRCSSFCFIADACVRNQMCIYFTVVSKARPHKSVNTQVVPHGGRSSLNPDSIRPSSASPPAPTPNVVCSAARQRPPSSRQCLLSLVGPSWRLSVAKADDLQVPAWCLVPGRKHSAPQSASGRDEHAPRVGLYLAPRSRCKLA